MERFLITGGQGFIGAWIAKQLLDEGASFVVFDRAPDAAVLAQVLDPDEIAGLDRRYGDIADSDAMLRLVGDSETTHIIHLAGLQVPACRANPVLGARVNVLGTLNVFEAAKAHRDRVRSVVYASSAAVAGPSGDYDGAIYDGAAHRPRTHYGVFKTANEGNASVYWLDSAIPSVGLRPLSVYGVGREIGITSAPTQAIKAAVLGLDYEIGFSGMTGFNFVRDVAADVIGCARRHSR
jgi:nucleoside-diphosphate-sugar epimerase